MKQESQSEEMMEGKGCSSSAKKAVGFAGHTVFSWSLEDIFSQSFFKDQVLIFISPGFYTCY